MNAAEQISDSAKFFEYGIGVGMFVVSVLLVLGILGLFLWGFFRVSKSANDTLKEASSSFITSVERMDDQHREERRLWEQREDDRQRQSLAVQEASNKVVSQLETTIRECILEQNRQAIEKPVAQAKPS